MTAFVEELIAYVGLDEVDRRRLLALHAVLEPHFPAIGDAFYAAALANASTAAILGKPEHRARLHATLQDWMSTGLRGPFDDAFWLKRARIGHRHVEIGLAQHFMIAGTSVIRRAYRDRIAVAYPPAEAYAVNGAVDRMLDVELAVMLRHYQDDSESRLLASERQRRLEQVEAMRTLCAGLAHEVRNPVNSAKLQLELAIRRLRKTPEDDRLLEPVERAGVEIDRLTALVDEFLAFAQPPALDAQPEDVVALVRTVVDEHKALAEERGVTLNLDGDATPVVAEVDVPKMRQIVGSLILNAIEAASAGGTNTVEVHPTDGHVHIRVTDDGSGIPPEVLPRIYEPFFTTKEGGTGMGMSIAHSLVALHRGTIDVTSSPAGTTFDVSVPRRSAPR